MSLPLYNTYSNSDVLSSKGTFSEVNFQHVYFCTFRRQRQSRQWHPFYETTLFIYNQMILGKKLMHVFLSLSQYSIQK